MSDENENVTFVGGKAIEQHESLDSNVEADTREEAMAAVREAIKGASDEAKEGTEKAKKADPFKPEGAKESKEKPAKRAGPPVVKDDDGVTPERGPDGKFLPKTGKGPAEDDGEEEEEPIDVKKASVKQLLKNREKLAKQVKESRGEIEQERQRFEQERMQFQQQMQQLQQQQRQLEAERAKYQKLRKDPAAAIREVGWEPEQFIVDLAREGTEEGRMARQQREFQEQLQEMKQWRETQLRQAQEWQQQQEMQRAEQYRAHIEKTFLDSAMDDEKYPHIAEFYRGRERPLIAAGDIAAYEFREMSGGREGSLDEILDFIEEDLAERAERWYVKKGGTKKVESPVIAKPGKGSKGKSLTPEAASERRSLGKKQLKDLDDDERRKAAAEAVGLAIQDQD